MSSLGEIAARWTSQLELFRRHRALVDGAALVEDFLGDIERLSSLEAHEVLTIPQASLRSGYSAEHLRRLVREGKLANVGRKHAPRVLARNLPRRAPILAESADSPYDPNTDARSLRVRR